jgi:hypothetical protein
MNQYLLLIQNNTTSKTTPAEWDAFFIAARASGMFLGGSALGERIVVGDIQSAQSTKHIGGFMRFDADDRAKILGLLKKHPVVLHGGSVELCEMPRT